MRPCNKKHGPKVPETGFDRVITLTAEEAIDVLRLLDRPEDTNPTFRLDREGFIRRRTQGGPTIGKVAAVRAVIFAVMRAGILVMRQEGRVFDGGSGAAPDDGQAERPVALSTAQLSVSSGPLSLRSRE